MSIALLPMTYFGPIQSYAVMFHYDCVLIDRHEHYRKQTYRNRCIIAAPSGPQALTVPIERRDPSHTAAADIVLSRHNDWRHQHLHALRTAYEASPYYQYYIDDIATILFHPFTHLIDLNEALRATIQDLLGMQPNAKPTTLYFTAESAARNRIDDFRDVISPKAQQTDHCFKAKPYHQVFEQSLGFLPNLSILDLLFNLGPEAILYLRDLTS